MKLEQFATRAEIDRAREQIRGSAWGVWQLDRDAYRKQARRDLDRIRERLA